MKSSLNFLVFTIIILTFGIVHSYRINNQNFDEEPQKHEPKAPGSDRSQGDTAYKWDPSMYEYGLPEILTPPKIYDLPEKELRRYPKEIRSSTSYGYNYFGPKYGVHGYFLGNEYPTHPLLIAPQGETWPARDSKNLSQDRGAFSNPDADRLKARFPFSPPTLPPGLTSSPLSEMKTQYCINTCPSTSEYNPVCGTNGVTYDNPGKLECAKYCGVDVAVQRQSPCSQATNTQPSAITTSTKAPFELKPTSPPILVGNDETSNPLTDVLIFVSTESPNSSGEDFDIDIRSRNLKPEDEIVFED